MSDLIVQAEVSSASEVPTNSDRPARKGSALPISRFSRMPVLSGFTDTGRLSPRAVRAWESLARRGRCMRSRRWGCALAVEAACVRRVRRRAPPPPARRPGCSVIKPLSGFDAELERDLESHAAIDYDGEWEVLLGLRDENDLAAPVARALAARHPDRVRLVVHDEESGANARINQLIALTRAARHEVIVCTDANVRVPPSYLREVAAALQRPGVGLVTHLVAGSGERRLGAVVDNQAWLTFVAPDVASRPCWGWSRSSGSRWPCRGMSWSAWAAGRR